MAPVWWPGACPAWVGSCIQGGRKGCEDDGPCQVQQNGCFWVYKNALFFLFIIFYHQNNKMHTPIHGGEKSSKTPLSFYFRFLTFDSPSLTLYDAACIDSICLMSSGRGYRSSSLLQDIEPSLWSTLVNGQNRKPLWQWEIEPFLKERWTRQRPLVDFDFSANLPGAVCLLQLFKKNG